MYEATIELLYFYEKSRTARLELALRFAPPHLPQAPQQVDTYDKRGKLRFEWRDNGPKLISCAILFKEGKITTKQPPKMPWIEEMYTANTVAW